MTKTGPCRKCKFSTEYVLYQHFMENEAHAFAWHCSRCNIIDPADAGIWIAKEKVQAHLTPEQIELLPIVMPNFYGRCTRCGCRGAELHHWAPKAIFGPMESEQWPKDYLCKPCHDIWHSKVTPQFLKQKP